MYHGLVLSWLWHLHPLTWMGVPWLASVAIALFAWSFVTGLGSVTFGLWAVGLGLISDRLQLGAFGRILVGTAMWCLLETVLSWGPLAWPFLSFTQSPGNLWILHLGQIGGPLLITAVIVAVNGCWAELLRVRSDEQGQGRSLALVGLLLLLGSHGCGWALSNRPLAENPAQSLRIGLIQGNIPTHIKLTPAGTRLAIARYLQGYQTLVAQGADAVLTPEGALPEIWNQRTQNRSPLQQAVVTAGRPLWLGTFRPVTPDSPQRLYQSLVTLDSQGQMVGQYNKVKLVPLGEYIPFEAILGKIISRLSPVSSSLQAGDPNQVLTTPFGRAIAGICYESAYSELFRRQAAQGGEWIMTASNNDPYPPRMMRQHHAHDVMRAIESDRWAVRVTNTGISGIVTPHGNTLWLATPNTYITHLADITRRQTVTPYVRYGNRVPAILIGLAVIAGLIGHLRSTHILAERDKPL
jgi:apolipoprotein N-acyltransferase